VLTWTSFAWFCCWGADESNLLKFISVLLIPIFLQRQINKHKGKFWGYGDSAEVWFCTESWGRVILAELCSSPCRFRYVPLWSLQFKCF
jgi:hypothetical protein